MDTAQHGKGMSTGTKVLLGAGVAIAAFVALGGTAKAAGQTPPATCDVSDLPDVPAGAGLRSRVQKVLPAATAADVPALKALLVEVQDLPGGCPIAAQTIAQKIADLSAGTGKPPTTVKCGDSSTWPTDVKTLWDSFEYDKAAFVKDSAKVAQLKSRMAAIGCSGNNAAVDAAVKAGTGGGGSGGPPPAGGDSGWCATHGGCHCDDSGVLNHIPPDLRAEVFRIQEHFSDTTQAERDAAMARLRAIGGSCRTVADAIDMGSGSTAGEASPPTDPGAFGGSFGVPSAGKQGM